LLRGAQLDLRHPNRGALLLGRSFELGELFGDIGAVDLNAGDAKIEAYRAANLTRGRPRYTAVIDVKKATPLNLLEDGSERVLRGLEL
jgi:hypothetical protein